MVSFKAILGFLFILLVGAIAILGIVCYQNNRTSASTAVLVAHTYETIQKADRILSAYRELVQLTDSAAATVDMDRLGGYRRQRDILISSVDDMGGFTRDNREQQARIDSLKMQIGAWLGPGDSALLCVPAEGKEGLIGESVRLSRAKAVLRGIQRIKSSEQTLLKLRLAANLGAVRDFDHTFIVMLVCISILLVATFFAIRYNFNKRIHIEKELRLTNVLFEKVFYESPIAIVISELDTGRILNCNRVFATTVNYAVDQLIGRTAADLGIFENQEERREIISRAESKGMARHTEAYITPRDKDPMYVSIQAHVIPLYDRTCLLTAILDLSTHKKAEDEIKKALKAEIELNRLKSNFVTLASHEFRTPLTTILSSAFVMEHLSFGADEQKAHKHLSRIRSSVKNLTSILDEFLSVTKIEEGQVQPSFERLDLPIYLKEACDLLQTFAKPGQIIYYSHAGNTIVNIDPVLLGNILNNLVSNSIKYSPENSPIEVFSRVNDKLLLRVKDSGIGIPEADQDYVFQRFYRASNAGEVQGTGLGLHIMKHYVDMLNGSIKLESAPGSGTQVEVIFDCG